MAGTPDYLLPFEAAYGLRDKAIDGTLQRRYEEDLDSMAHNSFRTCSSAYGPIADWREYPPVANVEAVLERRFGLYFDALGIAPSRDGVREVVR